MINTKARTAALTAQFGRSAKDTGNTAVQIALITERIASISDHLKSHRKDYHTQLGLLKLVGQRRRLLAYLKRRDASEYTKVLQQLKLRK